MAPTASPSIDPAPSNSASPPNTQVLPIADPQSSVPGCKCSRPSAPGSSTTSMKKTKIAGSGSTNLSPDTEKQSHPTGNPSGRSRSQSKRPATPQTKNSAGRSGVTPQTDNSAIPGRRSQPKTKTKPKQKRNHWSPSIPSSYSGESSDFEEATLAALAGS